MAGINLAHNVPRFLAKHPEQKFKAREIAHWIVDSFPDAGQAKKAAAAHINTNQELISQIVAEIGSQRPGLLAKNPNMRTTEGKPRLYYWTNSSDEAAIIGAETGADIVENSSGQTILKEHDLYPMLCDFLWADQRIYSMRIDEKSSSNKHGPNGNRWLFPDIVGMEDLTAEWHKDISEIVAQYAAKKCKLWSIEAKLILNKSNIRESFFQAVSNSTWANFGYLAAAEISGAGIEREMRMLTSLHGIGIIKINSENPPESEILFHAKERYEIDWTSCNRLAQENKDYQRFMQAVRKFHQTGDPHQKEWYTPVSATTY